MGMEHLEVALHGTATTWGLNILVPSSHQHSLIQQLSIQHLLSIPGTMFGGLTWEENRQNPCPCGACSLLNMGGEAHESKINAELQQ